MGLMAGEDEGHGGDVWVCDVRDKVLLFGMLRKRCGQMREVRMRGVQDSESDLHMTDGWPHEKMMRVG